MTKPSTPFQALTAIRLSATILVITLGLKEASGDSEHLSIRNSRIQMKTTREIPFTQDELRQIFRYDPETGELFWRHPKKGRVTSRPIGRHIKIRYVQYSTNRIVWKLVHGEVYTNLEIRHKNGDLDDFRASNLESLTHLELRKNGVIIEDGYRKLWNGKRYSFEHRVIMEAHIGRKLTKKEIIHHRDGDKLNNKIENLEILDRSSHPILHANEMAEAACGHGHWRTCQFCKKYDDPENMVEHSRGHHHRKCRSADRREKYARTKIA